jgi:hypothetical protein
LRQVELRDTPKSPLPLPALRLVWPVVDECCRDAPCRWQCDGFGAVTAAATDGEAAACRSTKLCEESVAGVGAEDGRDRAGGLGRSVDVVRPVR